MISQEDKDSIAYCYLTSSTMPVNSLVALNELREELDKAKTNCLESARNWKTRALVLFLMDQVFGQLHNFEGMSDYLKLRDEIEE